MNDIREIEASVMRLTYRVLVLEQEVKRLVETLAEMQLTTGEESGIKDDDAETGDKRKHD